MSRPRIYEFTDMYDNTKNVFFVQGKFHGTDRLHVEMIADFDGIWCPWFRVTEDSVDFRFIERDERHAYIDTFTHPDVCRFLVDNELIRNTGRSAYVSFWRYPLYEFTDKFFEEAAVYADEEE